MTETDAASAARGAALGPRLWKRVRIGALLLAILLGALGGFQIWQLLWASHAFVLQARPQRDLTGGGGGGSLYDAESLMGMMRWVVWFSAADETLATAPPAPRQLLARSVRGSRRWTEVEEGRLLGVLEYPGAAPGRLRLSLGPFRVDRDTLTQILTPELARAFLQSRMSTFVAVRNPDGDPVTGLSGLSEILSPRDDEPGVYDVSLRTDDLLWNLENGLESFTVDLSAPAAATVEVPLRWFLRPEEEAHVFLLEEAEERALPLPEARGVEPPRVTAGASAWGGRLAVVGRDLDRVVSAFLQHGGRRVAARIAARSAERLAVEVDRRALGVGAWAVVLTTQDGRRVPPLRKAFTVLPGLWWVAPAAGSAVAQGTDLTLRWGSAGLSGDVLIEAVRAGDASAAMEVYKGQVEDGSARWSTDGLDRGPLRLRLSMPGHAELSARNRDITIVGAPEVRVRLQITRDGKPDYNIRAIYLDGEEVSLGDDPGVIFLSASPGPHRVAVKGRLAEWTGMVDFRTPGEVVHIALR